MKPALWLGNVVRTGLDPVYLRERARLSDAAYWGDWHQLLSSLDWADAALASHGAMLYL